MVSTCIAASGVFAVARPNQGKAAKAPKRAGSKLWMPKSAAVDSPRIIVEGDKENKMAGLTELRKEVIMDPCNLHYIRPNTVLATTKRLTGRKRNWACHRAKLVTMRSRQQPRPSPVPC